MGRKRDLNKKEELLKLLESGLYPAEIARILKIKQPPLSRRIKKLKAEGLVEVSKGKPLFYTLTPSAIFWLNRRKSSELTHSSPGVSPSSDSPSSFFGDEIGFHNFKVKFPILKRGSLKADKRVQINNWIKEYCFTEVQMPITIEITTKSVVLHFEAKNFERNSSFFTDLFGWYSQALAGANSFLRQHGFSIDFFRGEVISQHIASKVAKEIDAVVPSGGVTSKYLGRKSLGFSGEMKQEAKCWGDKSQNWYEVESNDLNYTEKLLLVPEKVFELLEQAREHETALVSLTQVLHQQKEVQARLVEAIKSLK